MSELNPAKLTNRRENRGMINTNLVANFGQTVLDSSKLSPANKKMETKDPDEELIVEAYESDCEQCEIEKLKKPCSICEE